MKNEIKELLKEAYNSNEVCNEWKEKIKAVYPKVDKNVLDIGKWYKSMDGHLINPKTINGTRLEAYGFTTYEGVYFQDNLIFDSLLSFDFTPATHKEVKQALINEAKKRGVWNVPVKCLCDESNWDLYCSFDVLYSITSNALWSKYGMIFKDGVFAKPLETITKEEAEKQLGKTII